MNFEALNVIKGDSTDEAEKKTIRPFFWSAIVILFLIYIDAILSIMGKPNLMNNRQWQAMIGVDFLLSIAVYI